MINTAIPELSWYLAFISMTLACMVLLLGYSYPLYITKQLWDARQKLAPEELKKEFPNLLEGLKADKSIYLWYYPFFFLKQFALVSSLIALRGKYSLFFLTMTNSLCRVDLVPTLHCYRNGFLLPDLLSYFAPFRRDQGKRIFDYRRSRSDMRGDTSGFY